MNEHLVVDSRSSCAWGTYLGSPALYGVNCDGKGKHRVVDRGLACYNCWFVRKKSGDSNPTRWITKSYYNLRKIEDQRDYQVITTTNYKDIKRFLYVPKNRFTTEGLVLYNKNKNMCTYAKDFIRLNRRIGDKKEIVLEDNADSADNFF